MLEIKKQFRCRTAHVALINNKKPNKKELTTPWGILITSCCTNIGQKILLFDNYNEAIKQYNFLKTLTEGIEISPA